MKHFDLERLILAARPPFKKSRSSFTNSVMEHIKKNETFVEVERKKSVFNHFSFMQFLQYRPVFSFVLCLLILSTFSFTSYAYAIDSDPISLLKRWISGGQMAVSLNDRTFEYGLEHTYSDAAVKALADLNTVATLHMQLSNEFMVPKNGFEYVGDPNGDFVYPWFGVVEQYKDSTLYVRKQYVAGDKASKAMEEDTLIALPKAYTLFYVNGEATSIGLVQVGTVVEVFEDKYLEHTIGSQEYPKAIDQFFVFELPHSVEAIKEATSFEDLSSEQPAPAKESELLLHESSFYGGLNSTCLNNGADLCTFAEGESLYENEFNPNVIPFGEMLPDPSSAPQDLIVRGTEGKVVEIDSNTIVIKSSSGTLWTLTYNGAPKLELGDTLAVTFLAQLNNLDNKHLEDRSIYQIERLIQE